MHINSLPRGEQFIILRDFNTVVGSIEDKDQRYDVFEPRGCGVANDAGKDIKLLSF